MDITQAIAEKVLATVDAGLVRGIGEPEPGKMCVEAAVCFAMGLPHSDRPTCVAPALRSLKIGLNDRSWSSPEARAKGLRRLALAQLGSAGVLGEKEFRRRVVDMTIRKAVPAGLRSAASVNPKHAEALEEASVRCEREGTIEACDSARVTARAADADADADAYATAAADAYAYADAYAAAYAAVDAAAAVAAAADAYAYADAAAARDAALSQYAEWVVEILIDMKAPGCQWLELAPLAME